jgi:hypothetical protein
MQNVNDATVLLTQDGTKPYDIGHLNLLNPTGYVTYQQFNIQQLYALPHTLYLCVLYLSENKQRTCATYRIKDRKSVV